MYTLCTVKASFQYLVHMGNSLAGNRRFSRTKSSVLLIIDKPYTAILFYYPLIATLAPSLDDTIGAQRRQLEALEKVSCSV